MVRLVALALLALAACGPPPFVERATRGVWDPDGPDFWDRPLPSDRRRGPSGRFDLRRYPGADASDLLEDWFSVADARLDGWGVSSGVFHRFTGPLDPASLPASPEASLEPSSPVFLLDVDRRSPERGRRFPLWVKTLDDRLDRYTPPHLLAAVPVFGFVRRPATTYALVVTTGVRDDAGAPVGRSRPFHDAFEAGEFAPLTETLEAEDFDLGEVAAAALFTTLDHEKALRDLAAWAERLPAPTLDEPWTVVQDHPSFQVLEARFLVPVIQSGNRPYTGPGEGRILRDERGQPRVVETQSTRLLLSLPKQVPPDAGFPLTLHLHGSGGDAEDSFDRGPLLEDRPRNQQPRPAPGTGPAHWLARRGVASLGVDFPLHGIRHRPADTSGLLLYNLFGNIGATIDNFLVSAMELTLVSRLAVGLEIDRAEVATSTAAAPWGTGVVRFDPARLTAMGQSMGSTIGTPWATVDPRLAGIVLSGAGGILVDIATHAIEPVPVKGVAELALRLEPGEEIHLFHPALHAAQNLWDLVDPVAKASRVVLDPFPGVPPKHVLMTAGYLDGYFAPTSQAAMAVALGVPLAGTTVEPVLPATLRLAGQEPVSLPLSGNLAGRTAAVLHYEAPNVNGHYVVFNQEGARFQYTCFLAGVGAGPAPSLLAPARLDDPCR